MLGSHGRNTILLQAGRDCSGGVSDNHGKGLSP